MLGQHPADHRLDVDCGARQMRLPAATTLSTMRAPIQATADGSTPATTVTRPNSTDSPRLVAHTSSSARLV